MLELIFESIAGIVLLAYVYILVIFIDIIVQSIGR